MCGESESESAIHETEFKYHTGVNIFIKKIVSVAFYARINKLRRVLIELNYKIKLRELDQIDKYRNKIHALTLRQLECPCSEVNEEIVYTYMLCNSVGVAKCDCSPGTSGDTVNAAECVCDKCKMKLAMADIEYLAKLSEKLESSIEPTKEIERYDPIYNVAEQDAE